MKTYQKTAVFKAADITQAIMNYADKIEHVLGQHIMFGAVGGSYSLGLQNSSSDIDCYLAIDGKHSSGVIQKRIILPVQQVQAPIDFMCVSYQTILNEVKVYRKLQKRYPTVLFRTEAEKKQHVENKDVMRPDFKRSILFRILLSDYIMYASTAKEKCAEFTDGIFIRDIIDYQFTRIYGNYSEVISRKHFVPLRKYLYTIHEICTSESLMGSPQKPPMDFSRLIDGVLPVQKLKSKVTLLYERNRQCTETKTHELIPQDAELNNFIMEEINKICDYLKTNAKNTEVLHFQ